MQMQEVAKTLAAHTDDLFDIEKCVGSVELLAMLAEEAAELAQAALKLRRAYDGANPTPISPAEANRALQEEMGDVLLCMTAIGPDPLIISRVIESKVQRWKTRLHEYEQEGHVEK